jgi:hypothetical protein
MLLGTALLGHLSPLEEELSRSPHHRAAFSFQGVRKATQITAMHIIAMMATPIQTE